MNVKDSVDQHIDHWVREVPELDAHIEGAITRMQVLVRLLRRRKEKALEGQQLKAAEYDILWRLRSVGSPYQVTPTWLANALDTHPATLTSRLDRLEDAGHVARTPDPVDRRRLLVRLTKKGHNAWAATIEEQAVAERAVLDALTEDERRRLSGLLRKVVASVERHEPPLMPPVQP